MSATRGGNSAAPILRLLLTRNHLTSRAASALAAILSRKPVPNVALTRLDVNQNNIDEAGASALVDAAATANRSIVRLDLSWNDDVSKATKLKLARTLLRNVTDAAAARDAEERRRRRRRASGRGGATSW